jgi:hypothetical protein
MRTNCQQLLIVHEENAGGKGAPAIRLTMVDPNLMTVIKRRDENGLLAATPGDGLQPTVLRIFCQLFRTKDYRFSCEKILLRVHI